MLNIHRQSSVKKPEDDQGWEIQLKSVLSSLNQRLYILRRVANHIPKSKMLQLTHGLWMSKLRSGLQLCFTVRTNDEEVKIRLVKDLQLAQNRLLRMLNNSKIKDRVSTSSMLVKFKLLSVNQLAGQIKLTESWKSFNIEKYPIQLIKNERSNDGAVRKEG